MAKVNLLHIKDGIATFTLSNKPEYQVKVTEEDFKTKIEGKTCYYIKEWKRKNKYGEKYICASYPVRVIRSKCDGTGKVTYNTWFLHWDIVGQSFHWGDGLVVDHISRDTMDNTKSNLRVVTIKENSQNRSDYIGGCRVSRELGIDIPDGYSVAIIKKHGNEYFQCYYNPTKTYIKASRIIKPVLDAIEKHQRLYNDSGTNEEAVA